MPDPKPLILFIDAYDSFSNNIISLLETTLNASVRTIKIDNPALATDAALHAELRHYVAVVCGPGPGHPGKEEDVGIMRRIWRLSDKEMLPVLGICLGFQSLCLEFGGNVKRMRGPQHGIIRRIIHVGEVKEKGQQTIFGGVGEVSATLYQSLCADIGQDSVPTALWETSKWSATPPCPDLLPLAWVENDLCDDNDSGVKDERVLVAVQHKSKPFWALQYHPESICTNAESTNVITNWFTQAQMWNHSMRHTLISLEGAIEGRFATRESLLGQSERSNWQPADEGARQQKPVTNGILNGSSDTICHSRIFDIPAHVLVPDIVEAIQDMSQEHIILESSNANEKSIGSANVRGRYSIIGLDIDACVRFEYTAGKNTITCITPQGQGLSPEIRTLDKRSFGGIWPFLAQRLAQKNLVDGNKDSPFWGGFMGYTTYELGLETIEVTPESRKSRDHTRPDLCFAWVNRSLVLDHVKHVIYLQELAPRGSSDRVKLWMDSIVAKLDSKFLPKESYDPFTITFSNIPLEVEQHQILDKIEQKNITLPCNLKFHYHEDLFTGIATARYLRHNDPWRIATEMNNSDLGGQKLHAQVRSKVTGSTLTWEPKQAPSTPESKPTFTPTRIKPSVFSIQTPFQTAYESKVEQCQSSICAGNSYELCLTDQTTVTLHKSPSPLSSWSLYLTLRSRQPAPFASYIRLGSSTLISSSPERFLSWTNKGACELRPMKGTVRKSAEISTLAQAKALLDVPKEKAENLMIVDLVRHDLHGVCGSGNVDVPRLMVVEEYKSVFQMISVVKGQISVASTATHEQGRKDTEMDGEDDEERRTRGRYTGLDVLAASLPPGSMTGAPKKRSCEILQVVEEGKERGLYSGVVGYMDVGGRGDWSVTIRCMFKWDDEDEVPEGGDRPKEIIEGKGTEKWHIGAGGAVTALSTPVGEREEMLTKLAGTLGLFT